MERLRNAVLEMPGVPREDGTQRTASWQKGETCHGSRSGELEEIVSGDRKSQHTKCPKLCNQKLGNVNGTLASEHRRPNSSFARSVADRLENLNPQVLGKGQCVTKETLEQVGMCKGRKGQGPAIPG